MLTIYIQDGCAYCAAVLHKVDELNLNVEKRNIKDAGVIDELLAKGGKDQVPYLVDDEHNVSMYESSAIVDYLDKTYGQEAEVI